MKNLPKIEHKGITIDPNFCQMFTNAGNKQVTTIIKKCITKVLGGTTRDEIQDYANELLGDLSKKGVHDECLDTEPRAAVRHYIVKAGNTVGLSFDDLYI